ncbi:MAG: enoyl-CoA hydratase-related protein, partial [Mycobacterium sp.]
MNRPEAKNALSGPMLVGMADAWVEIDEDDDVRCAILTGAGGTFCAGADLKNM